MLVPETAMDEHDDPSTWEHQVRFARQPAFVQPVSQAGRVEIPAHQHLRTGVLRAHRAHGSAALFWRLLHRTGG
jgi:hypothetical protein